jgi:hypothetical protein
MCIWFVIDYTTVINYFQAVPPLLVAAPLLVALLLAELPKAQQSSSGWIGQAFGAGLIRAAP